jgi:hypothetical protein
LYRQPVQKNQRTWEADLARAGELLLSVDTRFRPHSTEEAQVPFLSAPRRCLLTPGTGEDVLNVVYPLASFLSALSESKGNLLTCEKSASHIHGKSQSLIFLRKRGIQMRKVHFI